RIAGSRGFGQKRRRRRAAIRCTPRREHVPEALDADALRRWCAWGHDALHAARAEIDALNVFPVADRDTGTNRLLTWEAVAGAGEESSAHTVAGFVRELADAAVQAAAGNSGVILARYL